MSKWTTKKDKTQVLRRFETEDLAWEYVTFLAKLTRSTKESPRIIVEGLCVSVEFAGEGVSNSFIEGEPEFFKTKEDKIAVRKSTQSGSAVIYSDGGSRGNPGPSATGFVVYNQEEQELARGGEYLGITTNNQAEYHSLISALQRVSDLGFAKVESYMDSQLVVNQIKGVYKVKNRDLYPLYERAKNLLSGFSDWKLEHIPRELNKVADGIANEVLDENAG